MPSDILHKYVYMCLPQVYKEKLRGLKKARRSLLKRVEEAEKRPKLIDRLVESINISFGFAVKMRNVTEDMQIFTEVEISTLEMLANETLVGVALMVVVVTNHSVCVSY